MLEAIRRLFLVLAVTAFTTTTASVAAAPSPADPPAMIALRSSNDCSPLWGVCNGYNCFKNATGTLICPECCGYDLVCMGSVIGHRCLIRWTSFAELCQAVRRHVKHVYDRRHRRDEGRQDDVQQFILTDVNMHKECAINFKQQVGIDEACDSVAWKIMTYGTIYNGFYSLSNGTSNCTMMRYS